MSIQCCLQCCSYSPPPAADDAYTSIRGGAADAERGCWMSECCRLMDLMLNSLSSLNIQQRHSRTERTGAHYDSAHVRHNALNKQ